jgi:hypothetical protein
LILATRFRICRSEMFKRFAASTCHISLFMTFWMISNRSCSSWFNIIKSFSIKAGLLPQEAIL